jgi:hypothetical protein
MVISSDYPLKFNNEEMYYPSSFSIDEEVIDKTNQTEAGTDQVQLVRTGKVTMTFETKCLADWLARYRYYSALASFQVSYYDVNIEGYVTKTVRMRNFKWSVVKHSYELDNIAGIYDVSFVLKEF